ncbi:MAG: FtsX-like permease family protein [Cyclobacteriaceae bacterium]|nr:FtsX-like permease family protein [Cyclobacteriaceae bacterium]
MFKNLLKISFRNLVKDKTYSAINIAGLTIGITCSLFLLLYILDETSFDRYHKNADNIYRIISDIKEPDNAFTWSSTQMPLAEELRDNYPEIENAIRFIGTNRNQYKNGDLQFYENKFFMADSTVFDLFSYDFLAGDPSTALDNPFNIVLTESIARKYFSDPIQALNQSLVNQQNENFKITGIIKDVPLNSHFRFDGLISRSTRPQFQGGWGNFGVTTYIQLPPNYDLKKIDATLEKVVKEKVNPIFERMGVKVKYNLQLITSIHLHSKIQDEAEEGGDITYIYYFTAIGIFMILIACINYMNLATARSVNRAKEVGLRKVMGSQRGQLIAQFLTESVLVAMIALTISLILIYALLPAFNSLANKHLPFSYIMQTPVLAGLVVIVLITGILGGSYPAFYLSGFSPVNVLKGKLSGKGGNALLRKSLVVIQFGLSFFMLISTLVVFDQLQFLRNKDLGFDKENVVRLNLNREMRRNGEVLADRLRKLPEVIAAGKADTSPGEGIGKILLQVEDSDGKMVDRGADIFSADYEYLNTMRMKITEGRNFSKDNPGDTAFAVIVNESMVKRMGWKDPLGKKFVFGGGPNASPERKVVGVIKDYNQNSLYDAIEPMFIILQREQNYVFVRIAKGDIRNSIAAVEREWKQVFPNNPFEYVFLDEDLDSQYKADEKRSQIFTAFSGLTIIIACLGLLGLAAYTTEQRRKEIGVRKVIGANVNNLVVMVSKEFFMLVSIGIVISLPVAWYVTNDWLQKFTYHLELKNEWKMFVLSATVALVITFFTVGYHVVRAAMANPVSSLRDE